MIGFFRRGPRYAAATRYLLTSKSSDILGKPLPPPTKLGRKVVKVTNPYETNGFEISKPSIFPNKLEGFSTSALKPMVFLRFEKNLPFYWEILKVFFYENHLFHRVG